MTGLLAPVGGLVDSFALADELAYPKLELDSSATGALLWPRSCPGCSSRKAQHSHLKSSAWCPMLSFVKRTTLEHKCIAKSHISEAGFEIIDLKKV